MNSKLLKLYLSAAKRITIDSKGDISDLRREDNPSLNISFPNLERPYAYLLWRGDKYC